jgi:hypothetical protein
MAAIAAGIINLAWGDFEACPSADSCLRQPPSDLGIAAVIGEAQSSYPRFV